MGGNRWLRILTAEDGSGFTPRGLYSGATTYEFLDLVVNQSSSWVYTSVTPGSGVAPPTLPTETNSRWQLVAKVGPQDTTPPTHLQANSDPFPPVPFKPTIYAKWVTMPWLDSGSSFASASGNRAYLDKKGILQYAAASVPRFHTYYPSGEGGLLLEPGRTNLQVRSQEFDNGNWTKDGTTVTADAIAAPDGMVTADKIVETAAAGGHRIYPTSSIVKAASALPYSYSVYIKAAERSRGQILFYDGSSSTSWAFDLGAGTINAPSGSAFTTPSQFLDTLPNGWFRIRITATTPATTSMNALVYLQDNTGSNSYTGDGVSGFYLWGSQLEQAVFPSSYIATTTAQVSRSGESLTISISDPNPLEGTFYARTAEQDAAPPAGQTNINVALGNSAATFGQDCYVSRNASSSSLSPAAAPVFMSSAVAGTPQLSKYAARVQGNDSVLCVNGTLGPVDNSCAMPANINRLSIGGAPWASSNQPLAVIQEIAYIPRALSNAQLQAITS